MHTYRFCFLLLLFMSGFSVSVGQNTDLDEYFDEGPDDRSVQGRDYNPNILKLDLASMWMGDVRLIYERRLTDMWAVEVGLGPNWPVPLVSEDFPNPLYLLNEEKVLPGWSASAAVRNYGWFGLLGDRFYSGLMLRNRAYRLDQEDPLSLREVYYTTGFQFEPKFRLVLNFETGIGGIFASRPFETGPSFDRQERQNFLSPNYRLGIGYSF